MSVLTEFPVSAVIPDLDDDGLLGDFAEGSRLIGTRCDDCGQTMIGARIVCSTCVSRDVTRIALPTTGVLYSYTRLHVGTDEPRALGYVDLPGGVRTLTDLREDRPLVLDAPVELVVDGDAWFFEAVTA